MRYPWSLVRSRIRHENGVAGAFGGVGNGEVRRTGPGKGARSGWAALLLCFALSLSAGAYEQKPGTLGVGLQGGAGLSSGQGEFKVGTRGTPIAYADYFGGPALGIRLRYTLDRGHAIGISFDDLRFDRKSELNAPIPPQYQVNNYMADYYVYLRRRPKTCPYVVLGMGVHRDTFRPDTIVPGSFVANFGLGVEYFVGLPFAVDVTARGYYLQGKGGSAVTGVLSAGFQYYLLN